MSYLPTIVEEGLLTLRKFEHVSPVKGPDDWYLIERAEHSGQKWLQEETMENGNSIGYHMTSARISDACVEGTKSEMLAIAEAIEEGGEYSAKRCAVKTIGDRVLFHSPRNSQVRASVAMKAALGLASLIRGLKFSPKRVEP